MVRRGRPTPAHARRYRPTQPRGRFNADRPQRHRRQNRRHNSSSGPTATPCSTRWASEQALTIWRSPPRTATTSRSRCCPPTPSSPASRSPRPPRSARSTSRCCCTGPRESGCSSRCRRQASSASSPRSPTSRTRARARTRSSCSRRRAPTPTRRRHRRDVHDRGYPWRGRLRRSAGAAAGCAGDPRAGARREVALPTREDQALIYRLSGDRNPLHSDPWFAQNLAGFPKPILHGLCTYGVAGRALVSELGGGDATKVSAVDARFTSPVFPGETLTTSIWRTEPGHAVFRTEASNPDGSNARLVLEDGAAEYAD